MTTTTEILGLFKYDTTLDAELPFNIDEALNSNWDIIDGGANDALAKTLNLEVTDYFDIDTHIGRVCRSNQKFIELKKTILDNFSNVRIVNTPEDEKIIENVGIISGFGLKNPEYVK